MVKNTGFITKLIGGMSVVVLVVIVIWVSIAGNRAPNANAVHYLNDNASADNKVEALKTMTADLLAVESKNRSLQNQLQILQDENRKSINDLKTSMSTEMQTAVQTLQTQNQQLAQGLTQEWKQSRDTANENYPIHAGANSTGNFIWVSDLSKINEKGQPSMANVFGNSNKKNTAKPIYTIPVNATLTGATLMTPLVGRVPIDGNLPSPYFFKLVLSAHNLTANGFPMPGVAGAVLSGIASGDMLGSCARGDIHSITFIFNDGTISTTESNETNGSNGNDNALGYISSQTGDPCIAGTFHSNAGIFLGAQMGLAGAGGYANALSQSQYSNSVTQAGNISSLIGSANIAALGQGGAAASQAAQTWWDQRVQNSFDYVYVPNIDATTGKPMKVVVNITQEIPINYDTNARKVSYETLWQTFQNQLD